MIEIKKDLTQKLFDSIKLMATKSVYVGIPSGEDRKDSHETNAQIAFINEFGSDHKHIPARPFLRPSIEKSKVKIIKIFQEGALKALDGEDMHITLEEAGLYAQSQVKNYIVASQGFVPLSPATIEARRSRRTAKATTPSKPLIDTAQMLNSITYVIKDR